nr:thioesterase domain-containing protein [Coxiella burnetii]
MSTIANYLKTHQASSKESVSPEADQAPLYALNTRNPHGSLFCVHGAGGEALVYQALADNLQDAVATYAIASKALMDPELEFNSIDDMANAYLALIKTQKKFPPYYLLGWSFGASVILKIAKLLEEQRDSIAFVGVIDPVFYLAKKIPMMKYILSM